MKFLYRVKENENIEQISAKFGVPIVKIISDNLLKNDVEEGDVIKIEKEENGTYIVKPFESLEDISKKLNIDIERLKRINNTEKVYFGQEIFL